MRRVLILGSSGAGKSTLARALAARTGLPLVSLDRHYWRPGWQPMPDGEWLAKLEELLAPDEWIADGNFRGTLGYRLRRADTVIFLDFPRWRCFAGVTQRVLARKPQADGCQSKWDVEFAKWIWHYNKRTRPQMLAAVSESGIQPIILRNRAEVRRWLAQL